MSNVRDEVWNHIQNNTIHFTEDLSSIPLSCIDGRQGVDFTFGVPGAAMGVFLSLAAYLHTTVGYNEDRARNVMLRAFIDDAHISGHTDDHSTGELANVGKCPAAGCGHVKFALTKPELYGLDGIDIGSVIHFLIDESERGAPVKCLYNTHEEKEVLFIHTPNLEKTSVAPSYTDSKGKLINQMFVYHPDVHEYWLKRVFEQLVAEYPDAQLEYTAFKDIAMKQVHATKEILAKEKPVLHLWVDGEKLELKED